MDAPPTFALARAADRAAALSFWVGRRVVSDGWRVSRCCSEQLGQADQVVGGSSEGELPADAGLAAVPGAAQQGDLLDPAEGFLDPLADPLAHGIAGMPGGPAVDRRAPAGGVLGDMRCDVELAHGRDEACRVEALVAGHGDPVAARDFGGHGRSLVALGRAVGLAHPAVDQQTVPVLHQGMADEGQLGLLASALAVEPGLGVGGRGVGVVAALLTVEMALAVAARPRRLAAAVLGPEALHGGPSLDQRAVDREVLVRQQRLDLRLVEHGTQELGRDLALEQPVAVLGEHRHVPHRIVDAQADKPAKQQVVVQLLHQLALRAHRVEGLQQQGAQQPFRRDRGPPVHGVELLEFARQRCQRRIRDRQDRPQRMIDRHPLLATHVGEHPLRPPIRTSHRPHPCRSARRHRITRDRRRRAAFSATC